MPLSHTHTHTHTQMPVFPASRLASAPQAEAGPGVGGSCHMLARPTRITNRLLLSRPTAGVWQWVRICISLTSEQAHCCHTHIMHTSLRSVPDKEDEINAGEGKEKDDPEAKGCSTLTQSNSRLWLRLSYDSYYTISPYTFLFSYLP